MQLVHASSTTRAVASICVALLLATVLAAPVGAQTEAESPNQECAPVLPLADVRKGMRGTGYTVERGEEPEPFDVEVLGVMENAIAPGRHLVVVDTASPALDRNRGVWAGMSGSPVYVDGRLLGAIAFGFSFGPSKIAGVTPAEQMVQLLSASSGSTRTAFQSSGTPKKVAVSQAMREEIARHEAMSASQVGESMHRLPTPLAISGLSPRTLARYRDAVRGADKSMIPYAAAGSSSVPGPASRAPRPGDNFAGALSYGDVTAAGVGTTTYVCNGMAVAFGHPFFWQGSTTMGANAADALTVIDDPVFGPYKLATIGGTLGTVDQDRLAGIRATLGQLPRTVPITSEVLAKDTGSTRAGRTDAVFLEFLPLLALFHTLGNLDTVFDQITEGSSTVAFTVEGTRADGTRWSLDRTNKFTSPWDISFESIFELVDYLFLLEHNEIEEVEITAVDVDAEIEETVHEYEIAEVLVSTDGVAYMPLARDEPVEAQPGGAIFLQVVLSAVRSEARRLVELELEVPAEAVGGGALQISGGSIGQEPFECLFFPEMCENPDGEADDFDTLLTRLEQRPRNDEVVARLQTGSPDGFVEFGHGEAEAEGEAEASQAEPPRDEPAAPLVAEDRELVDKVVRGFHEIPVVLPGPTLERVAGEGRVQTAVALSQRAFPEPGATDTVLLARADEYADALAAAPLAADLGAPVLLSGADALSQETADEVARLGATRAVLLGGTGALSEQVAQDLRDAGVEVVERIAGGNRFATAQLIAERLESTDVFVANGAGGWADAVAVSGLAALATRPILIAESQRLPEETRAALERATSATIVGGESAVSGSVAESIRAVVPATDRIGGATRYETSRLLADAAVEAGADPGRVTFVTGRNWPDALGAAPVVASDGGVLLLVDGEDLDASPPARAWLEEHLGQIDVVTLVGGFSAITGLVEQQILELVFGGGCPPEECPPPEENPTAAPSEEAG